MAKYHPLYDSVWNDEDLEGLPFEGKAFFVFLWSNPRIRPSGIYRVSDAQLAVDTGLEPFVVTGYLADLVDRGRIVRDGQWLFVRGYFGRQPNTPRLVTGVMQDLANCRSEIIRKAYSERYPLVSRPSLDGQAMVSRPSGNGQETVKRPSRDRVEKLPAQSSTEQYRAEQGSAVQSSGDQSAAGALNGAAARENEAELLNQEQWQEQIAKLASAAARKYAVAAARDMDITKPVIAQADDVPF